MKFRLKSFHPYETETLISSKSSVRTGVKRFYESSSMYTHIHTHTHVQIHTCTHARACTHTRTHTYTYIYI